MQHKSRGFGAYRAPQQVLVFNHTRILIGVARSMASASEMTGAKLGVVCDACRGCLITAAGYYMRRLHPDILIEMTDLDTLRLEEYDALCGEHRRYLPRAKVKAQRETFWANHAFRDARSRRNEEDGEETV